MRCLLSGINVLDVNGQCSSSSNNFLSKTPFSINAISMPMGLLYIAAAQRKFGTTPCEYQLYDFQMPLGEPFSLDESFRRYEQVLRDFRPDVIAVGSLTQRQNPYMERALAAAAAYKRDVAPECAIIAGGQPVGADPGRFLKAGADAVCIGEGEMTFTEFVDCVAAKGSLAAVAGLALPADDEKGFRTTAPRELVQDLDSLPMPLWELADVSDYLKRSKGTFSFVLTSRGCPYGCIYCHHNRKFRAHSAQRVADEFELLSKKYAPNRIEICDEIFNFSKDRVLAIRDEFKKRGLAVKIENFTGLRADLVDEETMDALKEIGFIAFSVAVESGTERVQKLIKKNLNIAKTFQTIEWAVERGIFVNAFFMAGFPTETLEEVQTTLRMAKECSSHQSTIAKVEVYAGTPLWELALQQGMDPAVHGSHFIERFGERKDPGYLEFSEQKLHNVWLRGVFDVYNDPGRMERICRLVTPVFFEMYYKKFYKEHGIWSDEFAGTFNVLARQKDYRALSLEADRCFPLPPLSELVEND